MVIDLFQKCPTTLRHKMANSKKIRAKYIADVPVLLAPEHVTESENERLKLFRDMMGWKHTKFEGEIRIGSMKYNVCKLSGA